MYFGNFFSSRYKDLASYKLASLQQKLSDSVPSSQMEVANRQYADLTAKYRDMLQKEQLHSVQVKKSHSQPQAGLLSISDRSEFTCSTHSVWNLLDSASLISDSRAE